MPEKQDLGFANAVNMMAKAVHNVHAITQTIAGFTAGTAYEGFLAYHPILNAKKTRIGKTGDTSLSDAGNVFVTEVATIAEVVTNGYYYINHGTGYYYVKAGATASAVVTYYIESAVMLDISKLRIISEASLTITTSGTPVLCAAVANAVAVRVINNNTDGTIMAVGLAATVDAISAPPIGVVLTAYSSVVMFVAANANEVAVDSSSSGKKVTVQVLGV